MITIFFLYYEASKEQKKIRQKWTFLEQLETFLHDIPQNSVLTTHLKPRKYDIPLNQIKTGRTAYEHVEKKEKLTTWYNLMQHFLWLHFPFSFSYLIPITPCIQIQVSGNI